MKSMFIKSFGVIAFLVVVFFSVAAQDCVQENDQEIIRQESDSFSSLVISDRELLSLVTLDSVVRFDCCIKTDSMDNAIRVSVDFNKDDIVGLLRDEIISKSLIYHPEESKIFSYEYKEEIYTVKFFRNQFGELYITHVELVSSSTEPNYTTWFLSVFIAVLLGVLVLGREKLQSINFKT